MQRLLVIRGGAVGDFIVTLPVLAALRHAFPQAFIELLGHPSRAQLASHPHYADRITDLEAWELYRLFQPNPTVSERLASYLNSFDLIVAYLPTIEPSLAENLQRYCSGQMIIWPPHPPAGVHSTDHLLRAVSAMLPPSYDPYPRVYITAEAQIAADRFWRDAGLPQQGVVAVHPGSGGRRKLWPLDGWQHVMAWVTAQGWTGVVIGGPAEQERDMRLLREAPTPPWPWTPVLPLPHLAALLARCHVVVGHDSGVTHLAAAVGVTTLALFGPTDPVVWGPRSPRACVLQPPQAQPLTLQTLAPEMVTQTLEGLLRGTFRFDASQVPCTIIRCDDGCASQYQD